MKILVVGSDKIFAIENFYVKYLAGMATVVHFPAQSRFYDYYGASYLNKILFKAGLSGIYKSINREFKEFVSETAPDAILVFKGMELFPSSLEWAKQRGIFLANYNPDNPFLFSGKGSGNKNITDSIGLYDLHFTYDRDILAQLREKTGSVTELLPFGFNLDPQLLAECEAESEVEKLCFLGNPDKFRADFLEQLAQHIKVDLYGHGWRQFTSHPNIEFHEPVYGNELWKTLRKYRVQLNLMRPHNPASHNMRSFEVPAVGGILLAPDTQDHREYFESGKEIFLYKSVDDCIRQVNYLLALSKNEAEAIRMAARTRSISAGYSYEDRAAYVYDLLRKNLIK